MILKTLIFNACKIIICTMMISVNGLFAQVTISATATHSSQITNSENGIIIQSGVTLTIDGGLWKFNENKKIELQKGAHLIVQNNARLERNSGHDHWIGIEALGDYTLDQYSKSGKPNNNIKSGSPGADVAWEGVLDPDQTSVIINAGSKISNARIGVYSSEGAIVRAKFAEFIDNEVGVSLNKYAAWGHPEINASYFMDCKYIWNTLNNEFNNFNLMGIYANTIRGLNIGGCEFTNNYSTVSTANYLHRGIGVFVNYSTVYINQSGDRWCDDDKGCPQNCYESLPNNPNSFNKLFKGITITNHDFQPVGIRYSNFQNCATGIALNGTMGVVINDNEFSGARSDLNNYFEDWITNDELAIHINIQNAKAFTIYKNDFDFNGKNIHTIRVNESQYYNSKIWRCNVSNSVTNYVLSDNVYGVWLGGDCKGLGIQCCEFNNQGVDWYLSVGGSFYGEVPPPSGTWTPILKGYSNSYSQNIFSNKIANRYNILIDGPGPDYNSANVRYLHYNTAPSNEKPGIIGPNDPNSAEVYLQNLSSGSFNCDLTCGQLASNGEIKIVPNVKIYPNPSSSGKFVITVSNNSRIVDVEAINELGQIVDNTKVVLSVDGNCEMSIYQTGLFLLRIKLKDKSIVYSKVIVE